MFTPYDWQEGVSHRAQYIEGKLAQGMPVVGISLDAGILFVTLRRQGQKLFEIYDRLIFGGLGQQVDVEALRLNALEFCSREGYNRSEEDVTIDRVVVTMSTVVRNAFADFGSAPFSARALLGELGETVAEDRYFVLEYDGDYATYSKSAVIAGGSDVEDELRSKLETVDEKRSPEDVSQALQHILRAAVTESENGFRAEALLLERTSTRNNRFRVLGD